MQTPEQRLTAQVQPLLDPRQIARHLFGAHILADQSRLPTDTDLHLALVAEITDNYQNATEQVSQLLWSYADHPEYGLSTKVQNRDSQTAIHKLGTLALDLGRTAGVSGLSIADVFDHESELRRLWMDYQLEPDSRVIRSGLNICGLLTGKRPDAIKYDIAALADKRFVAVLKRVFTDNDQPDIEAES